MPFLQNYEGLAEEDKFLLECNFDELVTTNGGQQEYWILAIQAAREACRLRAAAHGTLNAAGVIALQRDTHLSAADGAGELGEAASAGVRRDGDTRPRRGRGRTAAGDTTQRRTRGTTAG